MLEVVQGADAVVSALGPRQNTPEDEEAHVAAMRTIIEAMRRTDVRRLVTVLGAAIDVPGDRKGLPDRIAAMLVRRLASHVYRAKQREFELLLASPEIEWVGARPPVVVSGPPTGRYRAQLERPPGRRITTGDVADFLLRQAVAPTFRKQAPFLG